MSSLNGNDNHNHVPIDRNGQDYWRSLNEFADTPEFRDMLYREFPKGASELLDATDRRSFLKVMGASLALAGVGLSGCRRWPREEIAPFAKRPAGRTPGEPEFFASASELGGVGSALLVTSSDGRPTKIEGNPDHPVNQGATSLFDQASVLDLYDPDRSWYPTRDNSESDWNAFQQWAGRHFAERRNQRGRGLRILSEATSSPSARDMKRRLMQACPQATWHEYEPLSNDNEMRGSMMAFNSPQRPQYSFQRAEVIVALDSDFLSCHPNSISNVRGFARSRRPHDDDGHDRTVSRLYSFESQLSLTGANADERHAVRCADIAAVASYLAVRLLNNEALKQIEDADQGSTALPASLRAMLDHAIEDLQGARGRGVLIAGPRQPAEVHYLVAVMNEALGNVGSTITYTALPDQTVHGDSIRSLVEALDADAVDTLVILGGNPVYDAPANLDFAAAMGKAANVVHLSYYDNETSSHQNCRWHVNRAHDLESWGDTRTWDGTYTLIQPLIQPMFNGRSAIELLALIAGDDVADGQSIVKRTFRQANGASAFETNWRNALHDGFVRGSALPASAVAVDRSKLSSAGQALFERWSAQDRTSMELVFAPDPKVYDGRFANNGWLQELPDAITKITWDNAAIISVDAADELGVEMGDMITIEANGATINVPAMPMPGHSNGSVTVTLGYGREMNGRICRNAGFNIYPMRTSDAMGFVTGASVSKAGQRYTLASTQDHHTIAPLTTGGKSVQERLPRLVRDGTVAEYRKHPNFAKHRVHVPHRLSLFDENKAFHDAGQNDPLDGDVVRQKYAWGMTVDLNSCVGCGACVVACQAENNIPIVGKDQVLRGREMHWLRVDRYYKFGTNEQGRYDPNKVESVSMQPMMCVHCENAPCEQVCPVAATVHDNDGLNVMVYNRCIGTRYCSNNCPYKVRRFNYYDFHRRKPHREQPGTLAQVDGDYYTKPQASEGPMRAMQYNPEVTVRVRGVMEKCQYCIQRIQKAKIDAKNEWTRLPKDHPRRQNRRVPIRDGTVKTACQQACPAEAIEFGDLIDSDSRVSRLQKDPRAFSLLEELHTKPRTLYLARLRNPAGPQHVADGHHGNHSNGGGGDH